MKKLLSIIIASVLCICSSYANSPDTSTLDNSSWDSALSAEGHQNLKPEFTLRYTAGLFTAGPAVTAGIRLDDRMTAGIWLGQGDTYIDAAPGDICAAQTAAFMRRYFHLGGKDIISMYCEALIGCNWIYDVRGKYIIYDDPQTGEHNKTERISENNGDTELFAGINAGVRLRLVRNVHLFVGPTLTSNTVGLHMGIGF